MGDNQKPLPTQPSFIGHKVYLRPTTAEDITNVHYWNVQSEPQSMACRALIFRTATESVERFRKSEKSANDQSFTVIRKKDKVPLGLVRFFGYNQLNRSAELGLLIDPDEQKKGYGADALKVLCRYLFNFRGLNKVHAQTPIFNKGAIKLLEKLEFKKDATLRDHYFYNGEFHNGFIYSMLLCELHEWDPMGL
ncbi:MAG: GNAT family protein [candidate division Zixibacteria bacterium]|nr:GNAT family protein [candidate division Zixibacteria bacterium]